MHIPRVMIAGTHRGCGKTSVAAGLLRTLSRRGIAVQPYKVGPDVFDPPLLGAAAGRPCRTLDAWMLPPATLLEVFARGAEGAGVAVVEGMMGLYDGVGRWGDEASTAEVARLLAAPIVLVVDLSTSTRSAAASALGFTVFDPQLTIAGAIATRAGTPRDVQVLRDALASSGIALLGALPDDTAQGRPDALGDAVAAGVDVEAVLHIARTAPPVVLSAPASFPPMPLPLSVRIGVARDDAFAFYYPDALEILEASGAQLVPFSPLRDTSLPPMDGLYLGGGAPEVYAASLAANAPMRHTIAEAVRSAIPVYAEGGGFLYLVERFVDAAGGVHEMAGAVPGSVRLQHRPAAPAYVTLEALEDSLLLRSGESVRAHEPYAVTMDMAEPFSFAYRSADGRGIWEGHDGVRLPGGVASAAQVHFAGNPAMAQRFIEACRAYRVSRTGARV